MAFPLLALAGLTIASLVAGEDARKEQRRGQRIKQRIAERKEVREKQKQLRASAIQRAQVITAGAGSGVLDSSAIEGGSDSVQTQAAGNIGFINQISSMNEELFKSNQKVNRKQGQAATYGAAASIAGQFVEP